jgi:hypothetical protein
MAAIFRIRLINVIAKKLPILVYRINEWGAIKVGCGALERSMVTKVRNGVLTNQESGHHVSIVWP